MRITSAFVAASLALPHIPTLAKNWIEDYHAEEARVAPFVSPYEVETAHVIAEPPVSTMTKKVTQNYANSSFRLKTTIAQLNTYANLADGWDGEDSRAPSAETVAAAWHLLESIPAGVSIPYPMISNEGAIGFYWSDDKAFAELEVDAETNLFSLYTKQRTGDKSEQFFENLAIDADTHKFLAEKLMPLGRI